MPTPRKVTEQQLQAVKNPWGDKWAYDPPRDTFIKIPRSFADWLEEMIESQYGIHG